NLPANPLPVESLPQPVTIGANSVTTIQVMAPFQHVPIDAVGFIAYYAGDAPDGTPIRVGGYFDVSPSEIGTNARHIGTQSGASGLPAPIERMYRQAIAAATKTQPTATFTDLRLAGSRGLADVASFARARPIVSNLLHLRSDETSYQRTSDPIARRLESDYG